MDMPVAKAIIEAATGMAENTHLKYLIVRKQAFGMASTEHAIVFSPDLVHRDVARCHKAGNMAVIAAGFCTLFPKVSAWGESESLKMKGRPEDGDVIKRTLGL